MIIVSDTSVLSALLSLEMLSLLPEIYEEVVIPQKVKDELDRLSDFGYDLAPIDNASWLTIMSPSNKVLEESLFSVLDKGEASAIALSKEIQPDFLAIDEKEGRSIAISMGIPVIGLLGILLIAKKSALIPKIKPLLNDLREKAGFLIDDNLYQKVLNEANELS